MSSGLPTSMKTEYILTGIAGVLLLTAACPETCLAQQPGVGAYAAAAVNNKEVVAAAAFAVRAQENTLRGDKDKDKDREQDLEPPRLELVTIMRAEQQVVAGMNYRLELKVKLNGKERNAEAIVWWQAWRKPDPYKLTSWRWK